MDAWLLSSLVCPRHSYPLSLSGGELSCPGNCRYPVVDGVPVMLLDDVTQTMSVAGDSLNQAQPGAADSDSLYIDSLALPDTEKAELRKAAATNAPVDIVVSHLIGATNGMAYRSLIGKLQELPIPELRLPDAQSSAFLDIGCSWGRWSVAAARKGYKVIGLDPSLGAVMAARRVARSLNLDIRFVVGDARHLPFKSGFFQQVFSYSVLQHFSREDASRSVAEIGRVLCANGASLVQMPSAFGVRCVYHQARRRFREGRGFEVRYWTVPALRRLFQAAVGQTSVSVDCFFGLGLQYGDRRFMPWWLKGVVVASEGLRTIARFASPLVYAADSIYLHSHKTGLAPNRHAG